MTTRDLSILVRSAPWLGRTGVACGMLVLLGVLGGCDDPLLFIQQRVPFEPPRPVFTLYWGSVVDCSGLEVGDYDRVSWFEIVEFAEGEDIRARWNSPHDITLRSDSKLDEFVVKHEILHDLLGGDRDHVHDAWQACGLAIDPD